MITIAHEARLWGSPNARMVDGTGGVDWGWEYRAESDDRDGPAWPEFLAGVVQQAPSEPADSPTDWPTATMAQRTRADETY
ncbi:hypothetical protein TMEN_3320 [Trichophyton mentagrophytes]|nr:hypothetical protein TMEN_3320 [Trichophyton mentagrophytes]